jgi:hypothetical protein
MNATGPFAPLLPGFDFLQGLMRQASPGLPGLQSWLTPSLDPAELEKRIQDLRTVQFWLEQNAKLLGATIQALEVQRMTLTTLQSMNLPLAEMARAMQIPVPGAADAAAAGLSPDMRSAMAGVMSAASAARQTAAAASDASEPADDTRPAASAKPGGREDDTPPASHTAAATPGAPAAPDPAAPPAATAKAAAAGSSPMADPMQWWATLTQQFGEIAARALGDGGAGTGPGQPSGQTTTNPARNPAGQHAGAKRGKTGPATAAGAKPKRNTAQPAGKNALRSQAAPPSASGKPRSAGAARNAASPAAPARAGKAVPARRRKPAGG